MDVALAGYENRAKLLAALKDLGDRALSIAEAATRIGEMCLQEADGGMEVVGRTLQHLSEENRESGKVALELMGSYLNYVDVELARIRSEVSSTWTGREWV